MKRQLTSTLFAAWAAVCTVGRESVRRRLSLEQQREEVAKQRLNDPERHRDLTTTLRCSTGEHEEEYFYNVDIVVGSPLWRLNCYEAEVEQIGEFLNLKFDEVIRADPNLDEIDVQTEVCAVPTNSSAEPGRRLSENEHGRLLPDWGFDNWKEWYNYPGKGKCKYCKDENSDCDSSCGGGRRRLNWINYDSGTIFGGFYNGGSDLYSNVAGSAVSFPEYIHNLTEALNEHLSNELWYEFSWQHWHCLRDTWVDVRVSFTETIIDPTGQEVCTPGEAAAAASPGTKEPTIAPTESPSDGPTEIPSPAPSLSPSTFPSTYPSSIPSLTPSSFPSEYDSGLPSTMPSDVLSGAPSVAPSSRPSEFPSAVPSSPPTEIETTIPSTLPSSFPSGEPTEAHSDGPSLSPSEIPSVEPTEMDSDSPTSTTAPSHAPSRAPSVSPSEIPTLVPSAAPSLGPSVAPSGVPSDAPSVAPSATPSSLPSIEPSLSPTRLPSGTPSGVPSSVPSSAPSSAPSSTDNGPATPRGRDLKSRDRS